MLVKGLDFALLEQNKAKVAAISNVEDDEALEQAFFGTDGGTSTDVVEATPQPKKKSRQDLVRELKEKRGQDKPAEDKAADAAGIEEAKMAGKFKPIGFKPIGGDSERKRRKKEREGGEKKKKKRRVGEVKDKPAEGSSSTQPVASPVPAALPEKGKHTAPEPDPLDPDFDIFAGVEEYAGEIEDDEDEDNRPVAEGSLEPQPVLDQSRRGWFEEPKSPTPPPKEPTPPPVEQPSETKDEDMEEEPAPVRLAPLGSSMSVRDILAIDDAATKEEKRKARKEKKKKKAELNTEGKVNRDYQKCAVSFLVFHVREIHSTLQVDGVRAEKIQIGARYSDGGTGLTSLLLSTSLLELWERQRGIYHLFDGPVMHVRALVVDRSTGTVPFSHFCAPRNVFEF